MVYAGLEMVVNNTRYYFELPELAATHDRRGLVEAKRNAFVARYGLKTSKTKKHPSWAALLNRELAAMMRISGTNDYVPMGQFECMEKVHDHYELFVQNRQYIYTAQPYDLDLDTYRVVEDSWKRNGLHVDISYQDAWWYPGRTPLVVISQFPVQLTK